MKHLAAIVAVFLLMGCQTTNTVPPKDTSPKVEPKVEKTEHQGQKPGYPGKPEVIRTSKPLFCGDPTTTLNSVLNTAKEKPFAMWVDALTGYNVIMLYNKDTRQNTILEYIPGPYACFLSVGKNVHIVGIDSTPTPKKSGISAQRGLTKSPKHGINIVQFDDAD